MTPLEYLQRQWPLCLGRRVQLAFSVQALLGIVISTSTPVYSIPMAIGSVRRATPDEVFDDLLHAVDGGDDEECDGETKNPFQIVIAP